MKKEDYDYLYKIVLVGDSSVGKTSFMIRYTKNILTKTLEPTIGVEYATKNMLLNNGSGIVKVQIWDTAGSEKYRSLTTAHYRKSVGAVLIYDLTSDVSFKNLLQWLKDILIIYIVSKIKDNTDEGIIIAVIGNKLDLVENDAQKRATSLVDIDKFCAKHNLLYNECSAKTGHNVKESLEGLIEKIYENELKQQNKPKLSDSIALGQTQSKQIVNQQPGKKCC